jgi:hypothetical protein
MTYRAISIYSKETGLFTGRTVSGTGYTDELLASHLADGEASIDGHHDHLSRRVDLATGEVVDYQPPQPSSDHEWHAGARRWQLTQTASERLAKRRAALAQIAALELSQARPLRELLRDPTNADARKRLDAIEEQIVALREF